MIMLFTALHEFGIGTLRTYRNGRLMSGPGGETDFR